MPELNPGQLSRQQIDEQLRACGWIVQDYRAIDFSAGRGIAVREVPLKTGPCDYLLLVDRKALGVVEAKKVGTTLSTVADQSSRYSNSLFPMNAIDPFTTRGGRYSNTSTASSLD